MTDDQHGEGTPPGGGRWDPLPQGDYDDGATAFVQLPEGGVDALLASADSPLAAPGHGYVPPPITVTPATTAGTDPAATGTWGVPGAPADGAQWHDPQGGPDPDAGVTAAQDRFTYNPGATGQWNFEEATAADHAAGAAPGHDVTGQWSIPVAGGDLPDESGEFTTSSLVEQWGGTPPATLPGGAPAPWATTQSIGRPWGPGVPGVPEDEQAGGPESPTQEHAAPHPQDDPGTLGEHPGPAHGTPGQGRHAGQQDAGAHPHAGSLSPEAASAYTGPGQGGPVPPHDAGAHVDAEAGQADAARQSAGAYAHPHAGPGAPAGEHPGAGLPGQPHEPSAARPASGEPGGARQQASGRHGARPAHGPAADQEAVPSRAGHEPGPSPVDHAVPSPADHEPERSAPGRETGEPDREHAPDRAGAGPSSGQPGSSGDDGVPRAFGAPGHEPDGAAHAGPGSRAGDGPFGGEAYPHAAPQPQWRSDAQAYPESGAQAYPGSGAEPGEAAHAGPHDDPGPGHQDAARHAPGPARGNGAVEEAQAAAEAADAQGGAESPADAPRTAPGPASAAEFAGDATTRAGDGTAPSDDSDAPRAADAHGTRGTLDTEGPPGPSPTSDASAPTDASPAPDGSAPPQDVPPAAPHDDHPLASYVLRVNGADRPVTDAWIGESLLYVLRERLGLAGAKDGCSQGECGACNVQVDGRLVASCLVPAVTAAGSEVRTVEGLARDGQPSDVQRALARCGAVQCGFCVPGMAMTVHDLLEGNPAPTELETRQALCGNLCRCSGYRGVVEAVKEVVAEREALSATPEPDQDTGDTARIPHQAAPGDGGVHPEGFPPPGQHDQPYGQDGGQA
ncbi:2Fe-2S iron-sulfur cluster-binding protein [Streptomyces sp. NPDC005931]|uniref:2Fe-2S iron-sulfur cluster-binding protein n=1 Tax=Streptomyces sp. NPDC005931 TaxID=3364737 RepID=UPI0036AE100A